MPRVRTGVIKEAATKVSGEPKRMLTNIAKAIKENELESRDLGLLGLSMGTVSAHNNAVSSHAKNLEDGVTRLEKIAEGLRTVATNWEKSDQPWVVR